MGGRGILAVVLAGAVAASAAAAATQASLYTRAASRSCLLRQAGAVAGLPPANPPRPPALFVYALAHDDLATMGQSKKPHTQLGIWKGARRGYDGIVLSFFESTAAAQSAFKSFTSVSGGRLIRNVVASWDGGRPSRSLRSTVVGCLRPGAGATVKSHSRPASLATFAGYWGGHTRALSITAKGGGGESASAGCCSRLYQLAFEIRSVSGTLTSATAVYRVTAFRRYDSSVKKLYVGESGKLLLRNGIVTNTLTRDFFCSTPAWGATGACGA